MQKTCEFKEPGAEAVCGAEAAWIADVGWVRDDNVSDPGYKGTSWSVALCDKHYQELLGSARITGTARKA
jgi:hypothetical protein